MFTIVQEETNKIQIFENVNFTHLLIVFTYQNLEVVGLFANKSLNCPYYLIDIVEVGENGTVDNVNGEIKLSPQTTWKGTVYGQDSDSNLFPSNATLIDTYNFQVKGDNANTYPVISPDIICADATAVLLNTVPTELSSTSIASGLSQDITAPDATAVVKDQDGNILSTENIPSGVTEDIIVNGGGEEVLYTYNYPALNTGQDVSFATGDDKWVRDNVFNPEVATWDTNLKWVFPVLDPNDPTLLQFGCNPNGSGNNIFGNKERFTDTLGGQVYAEGVAIDHYSGLMITTTVINTTGNFIQSVSFHNDRTFNSLDDWHAGNSKEYEIIIRQDLSRGLGYAPFNYDLQGGSLDTHQIYTSTTNVNFTNNARLYNNNWPALQVGGVIFGRQKDLTLRFGFSFRKSFTYNPSTKKMELY